ncbi:NADP-dependent oxidoreductase domain-containing protein [Apiospora phragmitis]|uniref:NADP-dependent oxidoreductase domain-containing protein n=1 Tax=Apiospora phragmitis TaxID=2905665 RepID=A0ABR1VD16_9PEZI
MASLTRILAPAPEPPTELGRLRVLSPNASVHVSPLQLGAMSIGDAWCDFMGTMDKAAAFALLDAFVAAGGNFLDTANHYQEEQSEAWLGEWMRERGNRDGLVLATKYTSDYRSHALGKGSGAANHTGNSRRSLHVSVRDSLAKLGTDYLDILYLHWWDYKTSIKEVMDSLHILVEQGKVLYLGVSDTPAWVVSAANTYAVAHGKTPFSIYQGRWNIMRRDMERDIIPMARTFGMALAPRTKQTYSWDVLGGGKFQTKAELERRKNAGEGLRAIYNQGEQTEEEAKMSAALAKVAEEHGTESVTAIALAYVRAKAHYVFPIVGGRKIEHLKQNIAALSIKLTAEQIAFLESVKPFAVGFPHDMLGPDPNISGSSTMLARAATVVFPNARQPSST